MEARLGLERCNSGIGITRDNITTVKECDSHVFAIARVADHHLIVGLEALQRQVLYLEAFMGGSLGRNDGGVADKRVVDTWIGYQVGLKLVQIDVQGTVEAETRCH